MATIQAYWNSSCQQLNLPNALSLSRAFIGLTMPLWWLGGEYVLLIVVVYAGISDWFDGWLARHLDERTPLGVILDPLADKCFINPFLLGIAITTGSVWFSVLFVVTMLYDIDNTYQRRFDIIAALWGISAPVTKPVTVLSKIKTAVLFALTIFALYPTLLPFLTLNQLAIVALGLVLGSWLLNRRVTVIQFCLGR